MQQTARLFEESESKQGGSWTRRAGMLEPRTHVVMRVSVDSGFMGLASGTVPRHAPIQNVATPACVGLAADRELEELERQRAMLAAKSVMGALSSQEALELQMITWAIDRAEAREPMPGLVALEAMAQLQQKLKAEVEQMVAALRPDNAAAHRR